MDAVYNSTMMRPLRAWSSSRGPTPARCACAATAASIALRGCTSASRTGAICRSSPRLELHDLWRAEVDGEVFRAFVQPFTLQLACEGERWRYTPDRLDVLADGSQRVVEVKEEAGRARTRPTPPDWLTLGVSWRGQVGRSASTRAARSRPSRDSAPSPRSSATVGRRSVTRSGCLCRTRRGGGSPGWGSCRAGLAAGLGRWRSSARWWCGGLIVIELDAGLHAAARVRSLC